MSSLLLLEDDALLGETVKEFLEEEGFRVEWALDRAGFERFTGERSFDLYLMDVKLPDGSAFELLKHLKSEFDATPAIFITSLSDGESLRKGFLSGCDDYLTKPFNLEELLWRIQAILRRSKGDFRGVKIDAKRLFFPKESRLIIEGEEIVLPLKESKLLELLVESRGRVVGKEEIYDYLWPEEEPSGGALRVYVNALKKYLGEGSISNIRGVGYRFEL